MITLFPASRGLLEQMQALDIKLAILTGKDRARTLQLLDYFGLSSCFDAVVASDQLCRPKPDPEGILLLLKMLDCAAEEAVMVGDSVSDILCAQRAGVSAIAVTWGIKPERVQTLCRPDYLVHDWPSLQQVLLELYEPGGTASWLFPSRARQSSPMDS
jgi:phosphoglycolate phosphatase-like HAD superfamily hydrolase